MPNSFINQITQKYFKFIKELRKFFAVLFARRKILIISDKNIINIPISPKFQAGCFVVLIAIMLWVSYTSSKYFIFESIISEKEQQLWSSNADKENLKYEVDGLYKNLVELNNYFSRIEYLGEDNFYKDDKNNNKKSDKDGANLLLHDIRGQILERIGFLENIVEKSGLNVNEIALNNEQFGAAMLARDEYYSSNKKEALLAKYGAVNKDNNIGGPYVPYDGTIGIKEDKADTELFDKNSFQQDLKYVMELENLLKSYPTSAPMHKYYITSRYGIRVDPIRKTPARHYGTDFVGGHKAKVVSTAPGTVIRAGRFGAYGNFIEIDHGYGITSRYAHLNKIFVKKDQKIERGIIIGLQGNSGRSTGSHLHYEIRFKGKPIDPYKFLIAGKDL